MTAPEPTDIPGVRIPWKVLLVLAPLLLLFMLWATDASGFGWALAALAALVVLFAMSARADRACQRIHDRALGRTSDA